MMIGHRLLILSCSKRKRVGSDLLPAIERYDGPAFRVVRKYLRECPGQARLLDIYILSAKFGLIPSDYAIPNYNMRMTAEHAIALQPQLLSRLQSVLPNVVYDELFFNLGKDYLLALRGYQRLLQPATRLIISKGAPGQRLAQLYDWLRGRLSAPSCGELSDAVEYR